MDTNDSVALVLAQLASTENSTQVYPVYLRYSAMIGRGALYHHTTQLRMVRLVDARYIVRNSGSHHQRRELHDQADVPLEHLRDLIARLEAGEVFQFAFDPTERVWRGTLEQTNSGAIYNTTVYARWRSTLVLNLIEATWDYDVYCYEDTST